LEEIARFAIDKEREGIASYEGAGKQEEYSGAKNLFEEFADEERKHEALLQELLTGKVDLAVP
jgi:rubrerythrin